MDDCFTCEESAIIDDENPWPYQTKPGKDHINVWKCFLRKLCKETPTKSKKKSTTLERTLGHWLKDINVRRRISQNVLIDPISLIAFEKTDSGWIKSTLQKHRKYWTYGTTTTNEEDITSKQLLPGNKTEHAVPRIFWSPLCNTRTLTTQYESESESAWDEYIKTIPEWEQQLLYHIDFKTDEQNIINILSSSTSLITCVSDGGSEEKLGSYGWIISNGNEHLVVGQGSVPGQPMSSQRAESCGKLAWITWLIHFSIYHKFIIKSTITSYCDNKSVVSKSAIKNDYENPSYVITPNFDIFKSIYLQQCRIPPSIMKDTKWVKGHQDSSKPICELSLEAQLNIIADQLASEALESLKSGDLFPIQFTFPASTVTILIDGKAQLSKEVFILRWRYSEFELQKYYERKLIVSTKQLHLINWAGLRIARSRLSHYLQNFSIKQMIGWLPTGNKLKQYGQQETNCPACNWPCENVDHLWTCAARVPLNASMLDDFQNFLKTIKTDPYIISVMLYYMSRWLRMKPDKELKNLPPDYYRAVTQQEIFGWNMFSRGLITQDWAILQELYFRLNNIPKLGDSWSASISEWIIKKGREIWLQRNEKTHNSDPNSTSRLEKETISQVRKMYESAYLLSANDRELFSVPIEDFIKQPWQSLQIWVNTAGPTVKACIAAQNERLLSQNYQITDYFNFDKSNNKHTSQDTHTSQENSTDQETTNNNTEIHSTSPNTTNPRSRFPLPASEI